MEFGICGGKIDDIDYIRHAENLGFKRFWVPDSQMIWSDCYAVLALAAQATSTIQLGTGVSVAGTRIAPVTAHSIATINKLAPGRTFLGIGTGNTAMRIMGQKPLKIAEFDEYLTVVRALLHGEDIEFEWRGRSANIGLEMPDLGYIDIEHLIPIYVSGFAPKSMALAGKHGDGLVMSIPPDPMFMNRAWEHVERGADSNGRILSRDEFHTCSLTSIALLQPGETLESDRIIEECGSFVISSLHYLYDSVRQFNRRPPPHVQGIWDEYCALVKQTPSHLIHRRIHGGHCTWLLPEERHFVTPELIRATCLAGTPEEIIEQIQNLEASGLKELMILPSLATQYSVTERFSREVMSHL